MENVQFLDVLDRLIPAPVLDQMCTEFGPRPRSAPKLPTGEADQRADLPSAPRRRHTGEK